MKNTFGSSITVTLFGESHGKAIGVVLDGLAPGMKIDTEIINGMLSKRRPDGKLSTSRIEEDCYEFLSGVKDGFTTGTPLTAIIENKNIRSGDYSSFSNLARPSHADFAANEKYHGFQDKSGGGHFSGRITAPLVLAGGVLMPALNMKGIYIGTHIKKIKDVSDRGFNNLPEDIKLLNEKKFAVLDSEKESLMKKVIESAKLNGDSVGGILETVITGLPTGLGEPWFDSMESLLSHAMFSIPGVKGVEFGLGFEISEKFGSEANDSFYSENGKIYTKTNNSGGINGGITNGMPIILRCAVKPTPTIFKEQETIDINSLENTVIIPKGRHDPAIIQRARIVADSMAAIVIADVLTQRFGTDFLGGEK